jgi:2-oxoglutarate ferredoxin oxidoreductase subunit alpha
MARPFEYPDTPIDRGKVLWEEDLERLQGEWARYKDVDGDGIPYRTVPGNRHPAAAYFARGTGHDEKARYSEDPEDWHNLLEHLKRKFEYARNLVPKPVVETQEGAEIGIVAFGSTEPAIREALYLLSQRGLKVDFLRLKAIPFTSEVSDFIHNHKRIYIVELNRDGQLKMLLTIEYPEWAMRLTSLAHTDGLPLTARRVYDGILVNEEI